MFKFVISNHKSECWLRTKDAYLSWHKLTRQLQPKWLATAAAASTPISATRWSLRIDQQAKYGVRHKDAQFNAGQLLTIFGAVCYWSCITPVFNNVAISDLETWNNEELLAEG